MCYHSPSFCAGSAPAGKRQFVDAGVHEPARKCGRTGVRSSFRALRSYDNLMCSHAARGPARRHVRVNATCETCALSVSRAPECVCEPAGNVLLPVARSSSLARACALLAAVLLACKFVLHGKQPNRLRFVCCCTIHLHQRAGSRPADTTLSCVCMSACAHFACLYSRRTGGMGLPSTAAAGQSRFPGVGLPGTLQQQVRAVLLNSLCFCL